MELPSPSISSEMSPLAARSPFRLAHCMNEGQMTPPTSPSLPPRHGPKLQLSKLFRRSRSIKFRLNGREDGSRTMATRPSVAKMKAPFPLLLPESPSVTSKIPSLPALSPGLRRMSNSYQDLRAVAQRQAASSPVTPLLPSPISRQPDREDQSYFTFHNPRSIRDSLFDDNSLNSEQILTYYCDSRSDDEEHINQDRRASWSSIGTHIDEEEQSTSSESIPPTPSEKAYCATIRSESGWLANTTSHDERMRRFKTRFYQVVQHPWIESKGDSEEDEVMLATVLVGPGKPKLIQIQRPPSSQASQEAEVTQSNIQPPKEMHPEDLDPLTPVIDRPSTPVQLPIEVSAFSPYNTPGPAEETVQHDSIDSCLSTSAFAGSRTEEDHIGVLLSSESLVPAPLSLQSRTKSVRSDSSAFSSTLERLQDLADPFGTPMTPLSPPPSPSIRKRIRRSRSHHYHRASSKLNSNSSWPIDNFPQLNHGEGLSSKSQYVHSDQEIDPKSLFRPRGHHNQQLSPTARPATLTRLRKLHKLNRILSAVTQAIDHFPSNISMLRLSSPALLELRSLHVSEQTYITALKRVFPTGNNTLLEILTAWILVDLWFEKIKGGSDLSLEGLQDYARCNPTNGNNYTSFSQLQDYTTQRNAERYSDNSLIADDEDLHRPDLFCHRRHNHLLRTPIAPKALATLGIGVPDVTSLRHSELALRKRAQSVAISVSVVGHRLVEALRSRSYGDDGGGTTLGMGWDEDLWRCLKGLIELVDNTAPGNCDSERGLGQSYKSGGGDGLSLYGRHCCRDINGDRDDGKSWV